ncbi:MAG: hypothetical protein ACSLEN_03215 [Candidatus Malihini olakiniferum]
MDKQAIAQGVMSSSESADNTLLARTVPYANISDLPIYTFDSAWAAALLDDAG